MKKLCWIIGIVGIISIIFWVGYSLGKSSYLKDVFLGQHYFTDELIATTQNILLLEKINEGKIDQVISELNSEIDHQIRYIDNSLPKDSNLDGRIIADKIFLRIAKYRMKYPRRDSQKNIDETTDKILARVLSEVESQ